MSVSPESGISLEEALERKWSLESLNDIDVQTLISMWYVQNVSSGLCVTSFHVVVVKALDLRSRC